MVIHEATNAYIPGIDRHTTQRDVTKDTMTHGHSTPQIAANFARKVRAKNLLLNHFSARYKGDTSFDSLAIMTSIEELAAEAGNYTECNVAAAWDMMKVPIPPK